MGSSKVAGLSYPYKKELNSKNTIDLFMSMVVYLKLCISKY